jgi:hypothetical protein
LKHHAAEPRQQQAQPPVEATGHRLFLANSFATSPFSASMHDLMPGLEDSQRARKFAAHRPLRDDAAPPADAVLNPTADCPIDRRRPPRPPVRKPAPPHPLSSVRTGSPR